MLEIKIRQEALIRLTIYKAPYPAFRPAERLNRHGLLRQLHTKFLASELAMKTGGRGDRWGKGFHEDFDIIHLWEEVRLLKNALLEQPYDLKLHRRTRVEDAPLFLSKPSPLRERHESSLKFFETKKRPIVLFLAQIR
ncbi:MAG: hypothetical protein U1F57_11850 [bacterium]